MQRQSGENDRRGKADGAGFEPDETYKTRLRELGSRLRELDRDKAAAEAPERRGSALGLAFRLAIELVTGLVVGGAIGWFLDKWLGTLPIMLLLFFVLGAAAGILNVIRTAKQMQAGMTGTGTDLGPDDDED